MLMELVSERTLLPYLEKLDKSKLSKVQEYHVAFRDGTAVTKSLSSSSASLPIKVSAPVSQASSSRSSATKTAKPAAKKTKSTSKSSAVQAPSPVVQDEAVRYEYSDSSAVEYLQELFGEAAIANLSDSAWKTRLEAMNNILSKMQTVDIKAEGVIRCLLVKPGWKESNFQILTSMFNIFTLCAGHESFNTGCGRLVIAGLVNKLGDVKLKQPATECLGKIASATSLKFVFNEAYEPLAKQKSPKFFSDGLTWMNNILLDFGISGLGIRDLVLFLKTACQHPNAAVRTSAVNTLVTIHRYFGPST